MKLQPRYLATGLIVLVYLGILAGISVAQPVEQKAPIGTIPKDGNSVIASWPVAQAEGSASLRKVQWHIEQGQLPGMANRHYAQAARLLNELEHDYEQSSQFWYFKASVLQHQHQFEQAMADLNKAVSLNPRNSSAHLLKASVLMTIGEFEQAKKACTALIGKSSIEVASVCAIEADSYLTSAQQGLDKIKPILATLSEDKADAVTLWIKQIAAELALHTKQPQLAEKWLSQTPLEQVPLSYLVLWADTQLALEQYQNLLTQLPSVLPASEFIDDPILVRLAIAERRVEGGRIEHFTSLAQQRIALRLARNDQHHAADLARYFLYVEPNPIEARRWATINFKQAKQFADKQLLQDAMAISLNTDQQDARL